MTPSSEAPRGGRAPLRRMLGLDPSWTVRFTADEARAREMARPYRDAGFEVRVLPLFPEEASREEPGGEGARESGRGEPLDRPAEGAGAGPSGPGVSEGCRRCMEATWAVATRRDDGPADDSGLPFG